MLLIFCWVGCKNRTVIKKKEIVKVPEKMDDQVSDNIKTFLLFAKENKGAINDSVKLAQWQLVNSFYEQNDFKGIWSKEENWKPAADSMFEFIKNSKYYGLYPEDYHYRELDSLRSRIESDSLVRMDAITWTKADLMLSDAFMETLRDLKEGRIVPDSISIVNKENYTDSFFIKKLDTTLSSNNVSEMLHSVEPDNINYLSLRYALKDFVDSMDTMKYLHIDFPYTDTLAFYKNLQKRLEQSGFGNADDSLPDSTMLSHEVKEYQSENKLKADGKPGEETIYSLNDDDNEKFKRIAITLDRYKQLPEMPESYVWVNIPGFYLQLWDHDSVLFQSKVIVGKPTTQTPTLHSEISNMVIFPNWTIPESIIKKEILPALKKDPGYLTKKGFSLVDYKGDEVNPYTVDWYKYKNGIPWKIVQGSGDDNALGIFKFNFYNPYSVYLHDTNQRYLFANSNRALSHGCVRVQKWESLAFYIARQDSLATKRGHPAYNIDSLKTWIANQNRKTVMIKKRLPLFIEYFTCVAKNDEIIFYKDIYNEDEALAEKYFANK
ncbi:MAG TPA: L,D-transpeptidase family protein [Hanamia sp.]|nr:L,D-transpeptidase family protein [Hanamia sp.]